MDDFKKITAWMSEIYDLQRAWPRIWENSRIKKQQLFQTM